MAAEPDEIERRGDGLVATNRKARHEYTILETYQCGLQLTGAEVKSMRNKNVSIAEAFARVDPDGQLTLYGMHVNKYEFSQSENDPERPRRLLVHKKEIIEMQKATEEKGTTLIPLRLDFVRGMAKITIGVARGKKNYDKRQDMKKKDSDRDIERAFKERNR